MYVRTDFHIYKIKSEEIIQGEKYYNIEIRGGLNKLKAEFGKQADTIEELCDEFVLIERNAKPIIFKTLQGAINNKIYDDEIIYGAIWTDKGLLYVAKMNQEGELELI